MKFFKFCLKWGFFLSIWMGIFIFGLIFYYFQDLPPLSDLQGQDEQDKIVRIEYFDNSKLVTRGKIDVDEASYYQLPQHLVNAVVAIEDRRFFDHCGIDIWGILRATIVNLKAGSVVQGGSTITQQLSKMMFLSSQRNFKRKIQEVLLAIQLERHFDKEQILTFYLNKAYFGAGSYGVQNAARQYFGKNVSALTLNESAILAGLLKAPSKLSPKTNRALAEERASVVIKAMIDAGFLTEENIDEILSDPTYQIDHLQRFYFADYVFEQLPDFLGEEDFKKKNINVTSTLNKDLQLKVEKIVNKFIQANKTRLDKAQIALTLMDRKGAILAMIGGKDYQKSQFNRAIYARRQPGSAFKPFIYLTAFENGMSFDDILEDKKVVVGDWNPENYNEEYLGDVTLEDALSKSLNSISVQLARQFGGDEIARIARKFGILSDIDVNDPTISLGTNELTLLELTSAYATIANDGEPTIAHAIEKIASGDEILYQRSSSGFPRVASQVAIENVKICLRSVVERGTGRAANVRKNIFGKTGTSQNFQDAWFVGFDDDYVMGIWIGNDNNLPTKKISGGSLPARLFGQVFKEI